MVRRHTDIVNALPYTSWIVASALGWWLGFLLVVALALSWDALGLPQSQFMVGVGMGIGLGWTQARVVRTWLGAAGPWLRASVIGLAAPFIILDLAAAAVPYSLGVAVIAASLLAGILQWRLLRARFDGAAWWIPGSVLGWALAAGPAAFPIGDLLFLVILGGGAVLGLVSGGAFFRLRSRPAD